MEKIRNSGLPEADEEQQGSFDFMVPIFVIYEKKWFILLSALLLALIAYFYVKNIPNYYESEASLLFEDNEASVVAIRDVYEVSRKRQEFLTTQAQLILSRAVIERIVDDLNLLDHPAFNGKKKSWIDDVKLAIGFKDDVGDALPVQPSIRKRERIIKSISSGLGVRPIRKTLLIRISYRSRYPDLAASVPNAIANAYVEAQMDERVNVTEKATGWLSDRLIGLRDKLENSEQALNDFQQQADLVDVQGVRGLASQELNESMAQLLEARRYLKRTRVLYEEIHKSKNSEDDLIKLPEILNNPLVQTARAGVVSATLNKNELAQRYGPKHPKMITAQGEVDGAKSQLSAEITNLVNSIEVDFRQAKDRVSDLERELASAKGHLQLVAQKEIKYDELKREVDINRQLYNTFLTRFKETREVSGFNTPVARIADPAVEPRYPIASKKRLWVIIAFIGGAGFAASIFIGLDLLLKPGIRNPQDVTNKLGQDLIGLVPDFKVHGESGMPLHAYFDEAAPRFSEAIRTLRTGVVLSNFEDGEKVICVTSAAPGEGKTTIALNLAFSLGQLNRVLIIDGDMRRPSIGGRFSVPPNRPGLADLLSGHFEIEECIFRDDKSGVDIVPAGVRPLDPQRLLGSHHFSKILEKLKSRYDRIIIDTPPIQAVSDALIIAREACSLLYVLKAESTSVGVARTAISRLHSVGIGVDGVVLNRIQIEKRGLYSDSYYGYDYSSPVQ
ncbi:GumC family protein [Microbulbifer aggregans]|uniref:GumC family protein n=1 Tax=Microbulbifer aggregans TaxID=1769779 RepID=UPI001CFEF4D9|nr:polysaccharide biosynthesis tyrosine autokinase [Microbulbifer aggregans]